MNANQENGYLVSAIVSTYKAERFLRGKLEDLEAQTIADRLEIVVVDAASPENERAIVEEFQGRYDNIRYLRTPHRETVYQAWNRGIRMAQGEFVTNANTDDRLRKDAYETLVRRLRERPDCVLAYPDMRITKEENASFERHTPFGFRDWPEFDRLNLLELCCVGPFPLWRRSLHEELGYFDERFKSAADYEFWLRAALAHDFVHVPEFLGLYWLSEETVSRKGDLPTLEYLEVQKEYRPRYAPLTPPPRELAGDELESFRLLAARLDAGEFGILPELERFLERHPRAALPHLELARIFYQKGEIGHAKKHFEKGAITDPGSQECRDALLFFMKSELYQALQHQTAHLVAHPDDLEAHLCAGMILVLLERREAALSHYRRALRIDPENAPARCNIAFLERALRPEGNGAEQHPGTARRRPQGRDLTSIVILTFNELACTRECLESIERHTPQPHEVILVDNGSTDGSVPYLRELCAKRSGYRLIENGENLGFAAGCNIGMREAVGGHILLLNNDVVVTRGWLAGMLDALAREPKAGLAGPMTNEIAGVQKVPGADYRSTEELERFADRFRNEHYGRRIAVDKLVGFALLFARGVFEEIGGLDPRFGSGNFEDDDFCLRAALKGWRCVIAGDVFIHHYGSRSFTGNRIDHAQAMRKNRRAFDLKWDLGALGEETAARLLVHNARVRGERLAREGKLGEAVDLLLNQGVALAAGASAPYLTLAGLLAEAGKAREALEVLDGLPGNREAALPVLRARCHRELGERDEARRWAERAVELDPEGAAVLALTGALALDAGDEEGAEELLVRALKTDPGCAAACDALASIFGRRGDRYRALQLAELSFVLNPLDLAALGRYHDLAVACRALPREEERLKEALCLYPGHKGLAYALIELLIRGGRYGEAIDAIGEAAARYGLDDAGIDAALQIRTLAGEPARSSVEGGVSLCMIVKDEARHLARVLASVRGLADELVVVDTGSSDRTRDIARIFGARLFSFPWNGSFADARNLSLERASGAWILVLDADEALAPRDLPPLAELVRSGAQVAYSFTTRNYTDAVARRNWVANVGEYPEQERGCGWTPSEKVRLFPNRPGVRFEGAVHELLELSLVACGIPIHGCDVPVHHYGRLDEARTREKQEQYYLIGLKKLEETGASPEALAELARQATELDRVQEAEGLWYRLLKARPENGEAYFNLGYLHLCTGEYARARGHALKAVALDPELKEASFNLAKCELFLGETGASLSRTRQMLAKWPDYPPALSLLAASLLVAGERGEGEALVARLAAKGFDCADFLREYAGGLAKGGRDDLAAPLLELAGRLAAGGRP